MKEHIEKMANAIGDTWIVDLEGNPHDLSEVLMLCDIEAVAEQLYQMGYRKQSEGKWINGRYNDWKNNCYEEQCSICGIYSTEYGHPYCPHCGAKMKGDKNEQREAD